jgi:phosphoglycerate dehydrogenase-like enzyme
MTGRPAVAVIDDTQDVARSSADWSVLERRADVTIFREPFADEDDAARQLAPFAIVVPLRERTAFTASLVARLPRLELLAMTGARAMSFDIGALTERGILVCNTGINSTAATAELAFALIMSGLRAIPRADAVMHAGGWHAGVPLGTTLDGKRLGVLGLGKLGSRVAAYGKAFGMEVVAWSQNLTEADAAAKGARRVDKAELFAGSDVVSLHLVLSERTRGIVGAAELGAMKRGALLVNTSRGPLVAEAALIAALRDKRIDAAIDVYDEEPLPAHHPLRTLPNAVLTPHLGYCVASVFAQVYGESIENILAFVDGAPIRMVNPQARGRGR